MKQICPSLQIIISTCKGTCLKNHIIIIFCFSVKIKWKKMSILTQIVTHIANTIFVHVIMIVFCISFIPESPYESCAGSRFLKHSTRYHGETTAFDVITRQQSTYLNTASADQFLEDPVMTRRSSANKQVHVRSDFFCSWFQRYPNLPLLLRSANTTAPCGNGKTSQSTLKLAPSLCSVSSTALLTTLL